MKIRKILVVISITLLCLLSVLGCEKKKEKDEIKLKGNCEALECIKQIKPKNTVEEVNKITGVDGLLIDKENNIYKYDLGNNETITLKYYSGSKAVVEASYDNNAIANKKVDLSKFSDLKEKIGSGITYKEFKKEIGGVDGVLIEKSELSKKYIWVSKKGGYIKATFSNSDKKCTFFSGYEDSK